MFVFSKSLVTVLLVSTALTLGACSKKNPATSLDAGLNGGAGATTASAGAFGDKDIVNGQRAGSAGDFQTNVGDRVYFANDQYALSSEGRTTLLKQASWLKQYGDVTIQVEGHADERGTREYNISLSARRATTVREFLISQGISAKRVATIAYGKERPAALCDADQCWTQNRRAITVITGGAKTS